MWGTSKEVLSDDGTAISWEIPAPRMATRHRYRALNWAGRLLSEASWPMPLRWEMAKISP